MLLYVHIYFGGLASSSLRCEFVFISGVPSVSAYDSTLVGSSGFPLVLVGRILFLPVHARTSFAMMMK